MIDSFYPVDPSPVGFTAAVKPWAPSPAQLDLGSESPSCSDLPPPFPTSDSCKKNPYFFKRSFAYLWNESSLTWLRGSLFLKLIRQPWSFNSCILGCSGRTSFPFLQNGSVIVLVSTFLRRFHCFPRKIIIKKLYVDTDDPFHMNQWHSDSDITGELLQNAIESDVNGWDVTGSWLVLTCISTCLC